MLKMLHVLVTLIFVSCATRTPQTNHLVKNKTTRLERSEIESVPFIKQDAYQCGPSTMAMMLNFWGKKTTVDELMPMMFTKGMSGTFQSEMLSTPRQYGLQTLPIASLDSLTKEIAAGHPVIVFQNLAFNFAPKWHYSVATGFDMKGPDIIMHSGKEKSQKMDMRLFERNWKLADFWGLLILPPDTLSASLGEAEHAKAGASLEEIGKLDEALLVYETLLKKWPDSYLGLIGSGNVAYAKKNYTASVKALLRASEFYPDSPEVWHNLATALGAAGDVKRARMNSRRALEKAAPEQMQVFKEGLKDWL
jgi:hypothetical protein